LTHSNVRRSRGGIVGGAADLAVPRLVDLLRLPDRPAGRWHQRSHVITVDAVQTPIRRRRLLHRDPLLIDAALAALLSVGAELAIWLGSDGAHHRLGVALVAPAITAPIAVRRRYPTTVGLGVPLVAALDHALWNPQFLGYPIANFVALYALTVWTPPRRFAVGFALITAAGLAASFAGKGHPSSGVPYTVVTAVVMLLVRRIIGDRERRARVAERERDVAAREAVVEERARIARELHDVIAHHVSMIVLQAGAERRVLDGANGSTREVLETIEKVGRGALTEMRRLLGMLRGESNEPLTPQPRLADVPTLVAQLREAGLPVELHLEGEQRELPVGIELSAYRIVQEALTNALKHAGQAHASVHVRYRPESLEVEIADDGTEQAPRTLDGGHGLVGMRERVALYGGDFQASRNPGGGFVVRALLPTK
jgi:signal transduction histidine kinase